MGYDPIARRYFDISFSFSPIYDDEALTDAEEEVAGEMFEGIFKRGTYHPEAL